MSEECKCIFCGGKATSSFQNTWTIFYGCNTCGRYEIDERYLSTIDNNKLASYLYYNGKITNPINDSRYFSFIGNKRDFDKIYERSPWCKLITQEEVDNWYPKTFNEKIDTILLGLSTLTKYDGDKIDLSKSQIESVFFVQLENDDIDRSKYISQTSYIISYLTGKEYVSCTMSSSYDNAGITILPNGLERIDELQKNQSNSKNAFIAMSFSDAMIDVRKAIKEAVMEAGYAPRIMDEIYHNKQIIPEMLYEIKHSKFTIAELTEHNNGAYYEAGYAGGLGKEVILLCKNDRFGEDGHFDVKQVQTILWKDTKDLKEQLRVKIEKTIF